MFPPSGYVVPSVYAPIRNGAGGGEALPVLAAVLSVPLTLWKMFEASHPEAMISGCPAGALIDAGPTTDVPLPIRVTKVSLAATL